MVLHVYYFLFWSHIKPVKWNFILLKYLEHLIQNIGFSTKQVCKWQYFKLCTSCSSTETWRSNFLAYTHYHPLTDMRVFPSFFLSVSRAWNFKICHTFWSCIIYCNYQYDDNTYNSYDIVTLCLVFVCFRPYKAFGVIYIKKNILNF